MAERDYKIPSSEREHFANPPVLTKKVKIKVHVPEELEVTQKHHVYDHRRTPEGNLVGYAELGPYEPSENQYPKILYHPNYGKAIPPQQQDFAKPGMSWQQVEAANQAFDKAKKKWLMDNRTQVAQDAADEERLTKKGWKEKPPVQAQPKSEFDLSSEEI